VTAVRLLISLNVFDQPSKQSDFVSCALFSILCNCLRAFLGKPSFPIHQFMRLLHLELKSVFDMTMAVPAESQDQERLYSFLIGFAM